MRKYATLFILFISTGISIAQNATIVEKQHSMPSYPFSDPNPIPVPGYTYPYFRFDGYEAKSRIMDWKMVEMENPYIKLYVTPEIGGKVWGAIEKSTGREFLYFNHAVKFRDVAMRGAWTSGGLEFNFGVIGHAPSCSSPVDYLTRLNSDGSSSCFIGGTDIPSGTRWRVEINLPKDKSYFTTRSFWYNPTTLEQSYYHWTNAGIKVAGNLEYTYPGQYFLGHDGTNNRWPVNEEGRQLSFYENNNFGGYKSYHVFGEYTGFYGGYWHKDEFGTGHYSDYDEKPGKKLWIWGLSRQGMIWENLLTDKDGQYTEIQSGRLFNQTVGSSSKTPFKHRSFMQGATDTWTEYWFPVIGTQGIKTGSPRGTVNIRTIGQKLHIWYCPNQALKDRIRIELAGKTIWEKQIELAPLALFHDSIPFTGSDEKISVVLGNTLLYDNDRERYKLSRPVEMPADFDWNSVYGLFLQGKELERQRLWDKAEKSYLLCLSKDKNYVPALTAVANIAIRAADFESAIAYSKKALSIDTYDAAANFAYGTANAKGGRFIDAVDGYSIASASMEYRAASYVELAKLFFIQKQPGKAQDYALKAVEVNPVMVPALELLATIARTQQDKQLSALYLKQLEEIDPLDHLIRFERYLANPSADNKKGFVDAIQTELIYDAYLELAVWYHNLGLTVETTRLLELAPDQPEVNYWLAWLAKKANDLPLAGQLLKKANSGDPALVFPFRPESIEPLSWAKVSSDSWKPTYYLALILWNTGKVNQAKTLFEQCGDQPGFYPFYIARTILNKEKDQAATEKDLLKAASIAPAEWRTGIYLSRFYEKKKDYAKSREIAESYFNKLPGNYYLGLNLAKQLSLNGNTLACVDLLSKLRVLPNEGATDGYNLWRKSNILVAMEAYSQKDYRKALKYIAQARTWPENLGVGKPYDTDERIEDFMNMLCYQASGNKEKALAFESGIMNFTSRKGFQPSGSADLLSAWIMRKNGQTKDAAKIITNLVERKPADLSALWVQALYNRDKSRAISIENEPEIVSEELPSETPVIDPNYQLMIKLSKLFDF